MNAKVVVVTGGASGIGAASARLLARHGAKVVVCDVNGEGAAALAGEIGGLADTTDVGDPAQVAAMVGKTLDAHGRIDVLLHAAGIFPKNPYFEMSDEAWRRVLRVNLDGAFYVTRDVGRVMKAQRSGTMILMTSDRGIHGAADFAHYAASKGGMLALVKSLALALGKDNVTVNGINPGMTDTPLARGGNPNWKEKEALDVLGTSSRPEEIAEIVLFLAGTAGRFMTGQIVSTRMRYGA
jgi:NAD(P)-dependent dehydrogenase (short-subunit alcohol dehydrogenase family)